MEHKLQYDLILINVYIGILLKLFIKWFVDNLGKRFHMNFMEYSHGFMSIRISQMKDHSIYIDQDRYATSIVAK